MHILELKLYNGNRCLINLDNISSIYEDKTKTVVVTDNLNNEYGLVVANTFDEIKDKILNGEFLND